MLKTEMRNPKTMHIDRLSTVEAIRLMNEENAVAVRAVADCAQTLAVVINTVAARMAKGGRLIYVGAGTSGRLGVLDAAECPPTFGVSPETVIGILAGGRDAMFRASEGAEDDPERARSDLSELALGENDSVVGISAAGGAAYTVAALRYADSCGCYTVALTNNPNTELAEAAKDTLFADTGAEIITGSTRLKAGTAQKLLLNMLSTGVMIRNGYVYENLMINLRPSNRKLRGRMIRIVSDILSCDEKSAEDALERAGWSIRKAVDAADEEDETC